LRTGRGEKKEGRGGKEGKKGEGRYVNPVQGTASWNWTFEGNPFFWRSPRPLCTRHRGDIKKKKEKKGKREEEE